jgi:hypothetical protein
VLPAFSLHEAESPAKDTRGSTEKSMPTAVHGRQTGQAARISGSDGNTRGAIGSDRLDDGSSGTAGWFGKSRSIGRAFHRRCVAEVAGFNELLDRICISLFVSKAKPLPYSSVAEQRANAEPGARP